MTFWLCLSCYVAIAVWAQSEIGGLSMNDELVKLVHLLEELKRERDRIDREIASVNTRIDDLYYELGEERMIEY
jgi:hypothetical protein